MAQAKSIIERIKALLAMGEGQGNEHEAAIAMARAHKLLVMHNLTREDVLGADDKVEDPMLDDAWSTITYGRAWCQKACSAIARLYFCKYYLIRTGGGRTIHHFVGRSVNVAIAKMIAENACQVIKREGLRTRPQDYTWQTSFFAGATYRVAERCAELVKQAEQDGMADDRSKVTAVAIRDAYAVARKDADNFLTTQGVRLGKARGGMKGASDSSGYHAGRACGNSVNLRPEVKGSATRGAIDG